jgi:phosphoribosyl-ATP pyrophosphohydrolase/phosphoribosyl-AMP cyclohydrolase
MKINYTKGNGLVPVIVQNALTMKVLMLGYMNEEALQITITSKKVTFFSRSKNRIWTKGEQSGNYLELIDINIDCDSDTILIQATPQGPTCHTGNETCFQQKSENKGFLYELENTISKRIDEDQANSYVNTLYKSGINKVAQKVGEEAIELVIEAKDSDETLFKSEAADLLFHFLILLKAKDLKLEDIESVLKRRI